MQNMWTAYFVLFVAVLLIYLPRKKRRGYAANKLKRTERERTAVKELAERFVGKDVYITLLEGNANGVVKEVTENGLVLENKNGQQIVNFSYVMKIREYPYKNGKRATVWGD